VLIIPEEWDFTTLTGGVFSPPPPPVGHGAGGQLVLLGSQLPDILRAFLYIYHNNEEDE